MVAGGKIHNKLADQTLLIVGEHAGNVNDLHLNVGRDQLGNAAAYLLLGHLRVFKLVADGNTLAGTDQLRQIAVKGMERETCHGTLVGLEVCGMTSLPGEGDS